MKRLMLSVVVSLLFVIWCLNAVLQAAEEAGPALLDYDIKAEKLLTRTLPKPPVYDGSHGHPERWCWFHPYTTSIPGAGRDGAPAVVLLMQRHLGASDYFSGSYVMRTDDLGATWRPPEGRPELGMWTDESGARFSVSAATLAWHAPTGKVLAVGLKMRYSKSGKILLNQPQSWESAYSVYDPQTRRWTKWRILKLPKQFYHVMTGCGQWLVQKDGTVLLPIMHMAPGGGKETVAVSRCSFDGTTLKYLEHGNEMTVDVPRGLCEGSLVRYRGRYYLTLRNDQKAYLTTSEDGLHYGPVQPWTFDNGTELGSYNTQQHWLAHSDGLFLLYTRRGANNDNVFRHRAPLFIAQVDPEKLHVVRRSERILLPNRGRTMGNFMATTIDRNESWVTVGECGSDPGMTRHVYLARVIWAKPNLLVEEGK